MTTVFAICSLILMMAWAPASPAADADEDSAPVSRRADRAFEHLHPSAGTQPTGTGASHEKTRPSPRDPSSYSSDSYLIGTGHGDLAKGRITCQRVAELSARTDLAKQIRVLVKEHAVDRVRERTGHSSEQDIEIVREELVQEYLQGVKIIDRRFDEANGTCSSTAVMPRQIVASDPPHKTPDPLPSSTR